LKFYFRLRSRRLYGTIEAEAIKRRCCSYRWACLYFSAVMLS